MSFYAQCDDDDHCKCPSDPKWLTLAIVVLPAVLPVIFEAADALMAYWNLDREEVDEEETSEKDEHHVK